MNGIGKGTAERQGKEKQGNEVVALGLTAKQQHESTPLSDA